MCQVGNKPYNKPGGKEQLIKQPIGIHNTNNLGFVHFPIDDVRIEID